MTLVPQVVDAVSPIPVVAAGGIFDGRGIAAALMLGAVGVNLGTRFLASKEAPIADEWKHAIAAAQSEDAVKVDVLNDIQPLPGTGGYGTVLRSLHTPFIDEWSTKREEARRERERLWADITARAQAADATRHCLQRARLLVASARFCPWRRSCVSSSRKPKWHFRRRQNRIDQSLLPCRGMSALGQKQTCVLQNSCPLYPQKRTCAAQLWMSALGQKRTSSYCIHASFDGHMKWQSRRSTRSKRMPRSPGFAKLEA